MRNRLSNRYRRRLAINLTALLLLLVLSVGIAIVGLETSPSPSPLSSNGRHQITPTIAAVSTTADLYRSVNKMMTVDCPASSSLTYPEYPPFGKEWDQMAKAAWDAEQPALARLREARSIQHADWPEFDPNLGPMGGTEYLNAVRNVANHVGDAALYQHFQGDDAGAFDTLQDLFVLSDLLDQQPWKSEVRALVAGGIRAMRDYRMMVIASEVHLTRNPADRLQLRTDTARRFISNLLTQNDARLHCKALAEASAGGERVKRLLIETLNRVNEGDTFAAMSLACHLFLFDRGRWPASVDELIPTYLPHQSIDPWGDGHQTIDYVLIKRGLPDGSDRPLVYSRCAAKGLLFYRVDEPEYSFYTPDPDNPSPMLRLGGGQFEDVAAWVPPANGKATATIKAFP